MGHVLFAAPRQLDRPTAHGHRQPHRLQHIVGLGAPTEPAAHQRGVDVDLLRVEPGELGGLVARDGGRLGAGPHVEPPLAQPGHRVHRLHRGVGEVGHAVLGLQRLAGGERGVHIAVVAQPAVPVRLVERGHDRVHQRPRRQRMHRVTPVASHGLRRLERPPGVVGDDAHAAGQIHHLQHASHRLRGGGVEAFQRCVQRRVHPHRGEHHLGQAHVHAEDRRAGAFAHHVHPRHRLAEVAPLRTGLQRRIVRQRDLRGVLGQFGVGQAPAVRGDHRALLRLERRGRHAQALRCDGHQRKTRRRTRHAHLLERIRHAGRAARDLHADELGRHAHPGARTLGHKSFVQRREGHTLAQHRLVEIDRTRRAMLDPQALPRHVQLLGDQRGQRGVDPLAHLGTRGDDRHALRVDADVRGDRAAALGRAVQQRIRVRLTVLVDTERGAAEHSDGADQETASGDGGERAHALAPCRRRAAAWTAARMRG